MKSIILILLLALSVPGQEQIPSSDQRSRSDIEADLHTIRSQINELNRRRVVLEKELANFVVVPGEATEHGSDETKPLIVVRVAGERTVVMLIEGQKREVYLSGLMIKEGRSADAVSFLNSQLANGVAYLRCTEPSCTEVELSSNRASPSLNCQLVDSGIAMPLIGNNLSCASTPSSVAGSVSPAPRHVPRTDVQVKGYYRKDGTYVKPHTRSKPKKNAHAQTKPCGLTIEQSPQVRGLKLGQPYEKLGLHDREADDIGLTETYLIKRFNNKDSEVLRGVSRIGAIYLDDKLASFEIQYEGAVKWESDRHFAAAIAEQLQLPTTGWVNRYSPQLECDGFFVKASASALGGILEIRRSDLDREIAKRRATRDQKRRVDFKP